MSNENLNPTERYFLNRQRLIHSNRRNPRLLKAAFRFILEAVKARYGSTFSWLGRPIIQIPQDMFILQEIIWSIKPDFVIETGVAHGGSIIYYASILELIGKGRVIGIDIDVRPHNLGQIKKHPLSKRINLIIGSSVSEDVLSQVRKLVGKSKKVIVCLDSNHTHDHVLKELEQYTSFISKGGYCVVFDTGLEDSPKNLSTGRPWGAGNNPKTAVRAFLRKNHRFIIDRDIDSQLLISTAPEGYLRCIKDSLVKAPAF